MEKKQDIEKEYINYKKSINLSKENDKKNILIQIKPKRTINNNFERKSIINKRDNFKTLIEKGTNDSNIDKNI